MAPFVRQGSIVRRIRGDADTILFGFAGSAAKFALNRAVDWLFHSGKRHADPLGRRFSTARFAQDVAFVDEATAYRHFARIRSAHEVVEQLWRPRARTIAPGERDAVRRAFDEAIEAYRRLAAEAPEGS